MILDYISRMEQYKTLYPSFMEGMEFALSLKDAPVGKYEKDDYFALVQEMETVHASEKPFELHKKYLDVHIVLEGEEVLEYEDIALLPAKDDYNPEKDVQKLGGEGQPVLIKEGMFCLVFDHDGHKPGCCNGTPAKLRKIVLKMLQP